jgi:hypothetical protein
MNPADWDKQARKDGPALIGLRCISEWAKEAYNSPSLSTDIHGKDTGTGMGMESHTLRSTIDWKKSCKLRSFEKAAEC